MVGLLQRCVDDKHFVAQQLGGVLDFDVVLADVEHVSVSVRRVDAIFPYRVRLQATEQQLVGTLRRAVDHLELVGFSILFVARFKFSNAVVQGHHPSSMLPER